MKNWINPCMSYVINLIIAASLSFSFVYALTSALSMTYEAKDVFLLVFFASILCSIVFMNRLSQKIFAGALVLIAAGSLFYFYFKSSAFKLVYSKTIATFLWLKSYINGEVPLTPEYQLYTLLALSIAISLAVYLFTVKKFNFYVLLVGGMSLFAVQWILDYFVSFLPFYVFVLLILVCYFKYIYVRNNATVQRTSRQAPAAFLLLAAFMSALVFLFAYYMPASDQPLEGEWMQAKLNISNTGYFVTRSTGFSEESSRLGGNITLDDTLVMKVDSPEGGIYLKGAIRDLYTGSSWECVDSALTDLGETFQLNKFNADLLATSEDIRQFFNKISLKITYENLRTNTLFIPVKTESLKFDTGPLNLFLDPYGMLSSENFLGQDFNYNVEFYSLKKNNESLTQYLRNSSSRYNSSRYYQLPAELPERVKRLALEITSSTKNDYDRVKAIEVYLATNYKYTLEPGTTPKGRDFVDYFLFDLKQGYCTYYASAMTVLTRSLGIPARYVEGYVLPTQPVEGTTYEVTNSQAHAWVEVYFEGLGWIPFEPTSPFLENSNVDNASLAQPHTQQNGANDTNDNSEVTVASPESTDFSADIGAQVLWFLMIVTLFLLLLWVAAFSPLRRRLRLLKLQSLTPEKKIIEMYKYFLRALSVQGLPIKHGETPIHYAQRIDESLAFKPGFNTVTEIFLKARYSTISIDEKEIQFVIDFYSTFPDQCKERTSWLRYIVVNNM